MLIPLHAASQAAWECDAEMYDEKYKLLFYQNRLVELFDDGSVMEWQCAQEICAWKTRRNADWRRLELYQLNYESGIPVSFTTYTLPEIYDDVDKQIIMGGETYKITDCKVPNDWFDGILERDWR